jgi:phosphoglycerate dehydrogenase-like enzyme
MSRTLMNILVTLPDELRESLMADDLKERLTALGDVYWNETGGQFSEAALRERITGIEVCVTGWGSPKFTEEVLDMAENLRLVAHVGGSVAPVASEALYNRKIPVCSAVSEMAPFVAEGILGMTLASLRELPWYNAALEQGEWPQQSNSDATLFGASVGFVGLGSVGEALLDLLAPFGVEVSIYDPYVTEDRIAGHDIAELTTLEETLRSSDIVSIHAAKTRETLGMLDAERLGQLPDGALLVNAARGAIVEQKALIEELRTGRIAAALDVFEPEPLPEDSALRTLDNALLVPHRAGSPSRRRIAAAMVKEVERFVADEPLEHQISHKQFRLMTDESLTATDESGT